MRFLKADLLEDVVTSYDQTKTTIQGRALVNNFDGDDAIGPSINKFIDVFTDSGVTPVANGMILSPNGRLFVCQAEASGLIQIALYTINLATGSYSYVGKIQSSLPDTAATTTTFRSVKVLDSGTSGWKLFISTTGSVVINGGTFMINNLALSDFVPVGFPTILFATGDNQKAVYFLQDSTATGAGHLQTQTAGSALDIAASKLYVHNGILSAHQYYVFNTSIAPTYVSTSVSVSVSSPGVVTHSGHTFVAGDPVTFTAGTLPAGLTVGTVYFVRNPVAGISYELSATTGGAGINTTGSVSVGASIGRAFGTSHTNFSYKTGNLPALTGALLNTDSEDFAFPQHTTNAGEKCVFFATASHLYLGRLSELTVGATTWPSLVAANLLGTANQVTAPAATMATWSNVLDSAIYITNTSIYVVKKVINNSIDLIFGGSNNRYLEGFPLNNVVEFQAALPSSLDVEDGWIAVSTVTAGQRGVYLHDLRSNSPYDYSFAVTKVLPLSADKLRLITIVDKLYDFTGSLEVYYRTSGFDSVSGGWTLLPFAQDLSSYAPGNQIQFKILFATNGLNTSIPAQLCEFYLGYDAKNEVSDHWEYSQDDSSSGNPTDLVFRLKKVYPTSIPTLRFLANDLTDSVVTDHDSVTNVARFSYSTNDGVSYVSFGTPPNTVGTLVRYRYSTPPGVDIRPSIREA